MCFQNAFLDLQSSKMLEPKHLKVKDVKNNSHCSELAFSETRGQWVILLFVHQNENNVTSLVEFQLFRKFLTNHNILMYGFESNTQNAFDFKTANYDHMTLSTVVSFKSPLQDGNIIIALITTSDNYRKWPLNWLSIYNHSICYINKTTSERVVVLIISPLEKKRSHTLQLTTVNLTKYEAILFIRI